MQQAQTLRQRGFDYAAGELLRGKDPEVLEAQCLGNIDFNAFDAGIQDALLCWVMKVQRAGAPKGVMKELG